MTAPNLDVCEPWALAADLCDPCSDYSLDGTLVDTSLLVASNILYRLSGHRWPGECADTVYPCSRRTSDVRNADYLPIGATWNGRHCGCQTSQQCGCPRLDAITLGGYPVVSITEVKIDGAIVPASTYQVHDHRWLVRTRDADGKLQGWPCCADPSKDPDSDDDTFEVSFVYGSAPPADGVHAAGVLACELIKACQPDELGECRLPKRVTTIARQGVTMTVVDDVARLLRQERLTGLTEVDYFLASVNPYGISRRAVVLSPDVGRRVTRIT